jgi:hypothetical protein
MRRSTARRGISVVEVLIALIAMSIASIGLAGMLLHTARTATLISVRNARSAVATQHLNRLAALPYTMLETQVGCVSTTARPFPHTRCVTITNISGGLGAKQVRLIVRPLSTTLRPDTLYITRTQGSAASPIAS